MLELLELLELIGKWVNNQKLMKNAVRKLPWDVVGKT